MKVYLIDYNNVEFNDCYTGSSVFSTEENAEKFLKKTGYLFDEKDAVWYTAPGSTCAIEARIICVLVDGELEET